MLLKHNDNTNENNIEEYPIITEYKYLGILINDKMNIQKHIGNIDKKLDEYFQRNYILNKKYFSVKSIMLIFGYFHKSRLLYGLPAFIDQKSRINRIDNVMVRNIKRLLNITTRTNSNRLKISLGLPDLNTYLIHNFFQNIHLIFILTFLLPLLVLLHTYHLVFLIRLYIFDYLNHFYFLIFY